MIAQLSCRCGCSVLQQDAGQWNMFEKWQTAVYFSSSQGSLWSISLPPAKCVVTHRSLTVCFRISLQLVFRSVLMSRSSLWPLGDAATLFMNNKVRHLRVTAQTVPLSRNVRGKINPEMTFFRATEEKNKSRKMLRSLNCPVSVPGLFLLPRRQWKSHRTLTVLKASHQAVKLTADKLRHWDYQVCCAI